MSALDLRSGYFQLAINPSDIVKTAFVTKNATYAFHRMPFGLSGAAPNFQKAIDIILKAVIGKFVNLYMDDVIISFPSFTQHIEHLKEVFRLLQDAGLTLNKYKCKFGCDELKYLGLIINKEGIKMDETKVRAIVDMKPPRNSKEVSKFLEAQKALDAVKGAITKAPVLKLPDFKKSFQLLTDASSIGVEKVLNQEQSPEVFASRTLSGAGRNYTVTERECLAVVWALNKFRKYLGSLPRAKKEDLRRIASELELCVRDKLTVLDFMDLIKNCDRYKNDPDSVHELTNLIIEERKYDESQQLELEK
ncbi:retrovirus-related Pol polyprotein from transposon 297 [Trichonephila clavipes]|uniref:Retrovirus-related Pol polyprotein from transposon 297 n=1 Tax=Trichonephila clavipes TaxID=2585209 RepID=A0A8X7B8F3_TRICX|nr:retrovirus-related Pol polyprotein from transposon 297 [Trichonephila clavipes]